MLGASQECITLGEKNTTMLNAPEEAPAVVAAED
jgi:hypothetical protein